MNNHIQEALERFRRFAKREVVGFISDGEDEVNQYLDELDTKGIEAFLQSELESLEQKASKVTGETSDGYHTFNELYEFRKLYNAALFNEWANGHKHGFAVKYDVHKSKKHHDEQECFGGGWFIVMAETPQGQISNHYELKDWDLFDVPEKECANEWDGHSSKDVVERLTKLTA